jgi:hypothetical protein
MGTYKIMMGTYKFMMGTYKFMMGTYKFMMGTYKFIMGTYKFMMGTYKFMMGTYKMQVMHKFVLVTLLSPHSNTTFQNEFEMGLKSVKAQSRWPRLSMGLVFDGSFHA